MKIYLAGPDVFLPCAEEIGAEKKKICRMFGFEGLFPIDNELEENADAVGIFRANCKLMRSADIGVFNLSPFRGPSADAGTVYELGFMFAQGKRVYGYTNDERSYRERVHASPEFGMQNHHFGSDRLGRTIEDFGLADNLMIVRAIAESGGKLTAMKCAARENYDVLAAFDAFEACLREIQQEYLS